MGALLLALGLSLDGLGVGFSYGLRRIRIPIGSMAIIALCTIIAMGSSMLFSKGVAQALFFIPVRWLGASILIIIGGIQLVKARKSKVRVKEKIGGFKLPVVHYTQPIATLITKIQLPSFGLIIQVLKSPNLADADCSGIISVKESFLLGSALAMDAFAAGIGASLSGIHLSIIFIVALTQVMIITLGHALTGKVSESILVKTKYLPGTLLIILALVKLK